MGEWVVDSSLYYALLGIPGEGDSSLRRSPPEGAVFFNLFQLRWKGSGEMIHDPRFCDWLTNMCDISWISVFCYGTYFQGPRVQNALSIQDSPEKRLSYTSSYLFPS